MARPQSVETLEAKRAHLLNQIKLVDAAIKVAKERDQAAKSKAIIDALAARGLLDGDLETVLAAIAKATPSAPTPAAPVAPQSNPID